MDPTPTAEEVERREALLQRAADVIAFHVPDQAGYCAGCHHGWARLVPHTGCTQVAWARRALETYGVPEHAWQTPPSNPHPHTLTLPTENTFIDVADIRADHDANRGGVPHEGSGPWLRPARLPAAVR